jgi:hypothetical protein
MQRMFVFRARQCMNTTLILFSQRTSAKTKLLTMEQEKAALEQENADLKQQLRVQDLSIDEDTFIDLEVYIHRFSGIYDISRRRFRTTKYFPPSAYHHHRKPLAHHIQPPRGERPPRRYGKNPLCSPHLISRECHGRGSEAAGKSAIEGPSGRSGRMPILSVHFPLCWFKDDQRRPYNWARNSAGV